MAVPFLGISADRTAIRPGFDEKTALAMILLNLMPIDVTKVVTCVLGKKVVTVVQHKGGAGKWSCCQWSYFVTVP